MKVEVYNLPEYLLGERHSNIHVYHYKTTKTNVRHKIILSQNLICILLSGRKEIFGSHESVIVNSNEILLLKSGNALMWESTAENDTLESLLIFFSNELLKEFCYKYHQDIGAADKACVITKIKKDDFLINFQQSLKLLYEKPFNRIHETKLTELLSYLILNDTNGSVRNFINTSLADLKENKLKQVVLANAQNGLTIVELSFLCNMSVSSFKRHFIKTFNVSPKHYLTEKKMEAAKALLLLDKRPSDIYFDLKYQSLSSFITEFKKYYGVSPKQFQLKAQAPATI